MLIYPRKNEDVMKSMKIRSDFTVAPNQFLSFLGWYNTLILALEYSLKSFPAAPWPSFPHTSNLGNHMLWMAELQDGSLDPAHLWEEK